MSEHVRIEKDERAEDTRIVFGFWMYLMSDCVLFASLFAVYAVLHGNTFGGPSGGDIFDLPFVLKETLLLLTSSFTCGLALLSGRDGSVRATLGWLGATFFFGAAFLFLEISEFSSLAAAGKSWTTSGFLSSYFALVGTHGLHVALGLLWLLAVFAHITVRGISRGDLRKLALFSLFWHFLDIIWIFIFSLVYLTGSL